MVDDDLFEFLSRYSWSLNSHGYAQTTVQIDGRWIGKMMHRAVMIPGYMEAKNPGRSAHPFEIDHIDGNGLNNQRSNLRAVTHQQNLCNRGKQKNNTSGFKGVKWATDRKCGGWIAQIQVHGKNHYLGCYSTKEEAHAVYCAAAKEMHGECAYSGVVQ